MQNTGLYFTFQTTVKRKEVPHYKHVMRAGAICRKVSFNCFCGVLDGWTVSESERDIVMEELWKPVPDFADGKRFEVSSRGRVRDMTTGKLKKPGRTKDGFLVLRARNGDERPSVTIHRLVAKAFLPGQPTFPVIFKDENKAHCWVENLRWAEPGEARHNRAAARTWGRPRRRKPQESERRPRRVGQYHAGPEHHRPNRKLTDDQVQRIRGSAPGALIRELAKEFGVSEATISNIRNGKSWSGPKWEPQDAAVRPESR